MQIVGFPMGRLICAVTTQLISAFVFALPLKYEISSSSSSYLLCLYSPVCGRPGRKPRRSVFSRRGSLMITMGLCAILLNLKMDVFNLNALWGQTKLHLYIIIDRVVKTNYGV